MADNSTLPVNSGTEVFANDDVSGVKYPRVKVDFGVDGSATDVSSGSPFPVTDAAAETSLSQLHTDLATTLAGVLGTTSGAAVITDATGTVQQYLRGLIKQWIAGTLVLGASSNAIGKLASNSGVNIGTVTVDGTQLSTLLTTFATISSENAQQVCLPTDQPWPKGMSSRVFAAPFTTLTRPANTTAYTALDSISDNATAGSVTALSATVSDTNDDPIFISEILISSTDTNLAGCRIRAYLFNSDPTASSGVGAGDNVAYSQKKAGYIGSFSGVLESGFSDGTVGRLVPTFADGATSGTPHAMAGGFVAVKPGSGAKTVWIQYQAVDGFTPSANSTTIVGTARGWQGRAA